MIVSEFISKFEELYPEHLAYKWDNVGLQIGNENNEIYNVLIALDLTKEVVSEAIEQKANLIVVHHPIIFAPVKRVDTSSYFGELLSKIIKNDINIYVAHTNFDLSNHGMNKILADMINLQNQKIIEMETLEEGLGRYGELPEPISLFEFIHKIKKVYDMEYVELISRERNDYMIKTVAICGGSGSSLLTNDILENVDIYITGDVTYHHALDAYNKGLTVINTGHSIERHGIKSIKKTLENFSSEYSVFLSKVDTNPYKKL